MALSAHLSSQPCVSRVTVHTRSAAFTSAFKPARTCLTPRTHRESSLTCRAAAATTSVPALKQVQATMPNKDYHPSPLSQTAPETYAIIEVGGQQLFVEPGKWYSVNRLKAEEGSTIEFGRVLMYKGVGGVQFGTPYLQSVSVEGQVMEHLKGEKIIIYKMKIKKHYRRKNGHRQSLTKFMITKINATPADAPAVTPEEVKGAAAKAPEDKRAAVEELLTTGDPAAAVRITLKLH